MLYLGKKNLLGVQVDATDYESAVNMIISAAFKSESFAVSALAVHGVMTGALNNEHKYRLNSFDLITPDGQPVRLALNALYRTKLKERVCGPELTLKICQEASSLKLPIYLYGSKESTLSKMKDNLLAKYPNLLIAGMEPSKFKNLSEVEKSQIVDSINSSGAQILFVGLGCPRQEIWIYEHKNLIKMPMIAVGAAFDFHAGLLSMAPKFMQDYSLEWLYRLLQEPKRLWKRYLFLNPYFILLFLLQYLNIEKYSNGKHKPIKPLKNLNFG